MVRTSSYLEPITEDYSYNPYSVTPNTGSNPTVSTQSPTGNQVRTGPVQTATPTTGATDTFAPWNMLSYQNYRAPILPGTNLFSFTPRGYYADPYGSEQGGSFRSSSWDVNPEVISQIQSLMGFNPGGYGRDWQLVYDLPERTFDTGEIEYGEGGASSPIYDYDPNKPPTIRGLQYKSGGRHSSTVIPLVFDSERNMYLPALDQVQEGVGWNTNTGFRDLLPILAITVGGPLLGSYLSSLFGGAGAVAGEGALAGAGAIEGTGAIAGTGALEGGSLAELVGLPLTGTSTIEGASLAELAGLPITGTGALEGGVADLIGTAATGATAGTALSTIGQAIRSAGEVMSPISTIANVLLGGGGQGGGQGSGQGGVQPGGLGPLLSALYGVYRQNKLAEGLQNLATMFQSQAQPYMDKLRSSYEDPASYLNSPEMQAVLNLEANKLAGIDAARGRLSNDIQRTQLLQKYAQQNLENYRQGLRGAISNIYQPKAISEAITGAINADSRRYQDLAGLAGMYGRGAWSPGQTINDISNIINSVGSLWDWFSSLWD